MNSQEAIKTLRDALTRLCNECDLSGLRERAGFDHWLSVADEALASTARIEQPAHEEIIREGNSLVCTACGTTTEVAKPERVALSDAEIFEAFKKVSIEGNHSYVPAMWDISLATVRAILCAQADGPVINYGTKNATPPITQPLIAEATRDLLRDALIRMMSSDAGIAAATDDDLLYAINDDSADPIVQEQAAAVLQARAAISAIKRDDVAKNRSLSTPDVISAIAASTKDASEWAPITAPGQVKVGTKLRFTIGDERFSETAKQILHPGTGEEEIIYNKRKNYYLITSMASQNKGSQKKVEFLAAIAASTKEGAN